jgi:aminomethyltransferase
VDDVVVMRLKSDHFLLIVNAANTAKDYAWISGHIAHLGDAVMVDSSSRYALLAVQGPASVEVVQSLTGVALAALSHFSFAHGEVAGVRATVSRTGYTGEDGFELLVPSQSADRVWQALMASGDPAVVQPCGLGALDTLRLEAGLRLYGNDIDETTTALEAGLDAIVGWNKPDFIGASGLRKQKARGIGRTLVGFELLESGIVRRGHHIYLGDEPAGVVTSGARAPYLKKTLGLAYVAVQHASAGSELEIDVGSRRVPARLVALPFYKRTARPEMPKA